MKVTSVDGVDIFINYTKVTFVSDSDIPNEVYIGIDGDVIKVIGNAKDIALKCFIEVD